MELSTEFLLNSTSKTPASEICLPKEYRQSLAFRMFRLLLVVCCAFSIIACLLWVYVDYDSNIAKFEQAFQRVESTLIPGISKSLWELDKEHLAMYVEGICSNTGIVYAKISADDGSIIDFGTPVKDNAITREIPIMHHETNYSLRIGTLLLQSDRNNAIKSLLNDFSAIFIFQIIIIFSVATFFFVSFNRMVTAHLLDMATYIDNFANNNSAEPLRLNRKQWNDEFDKVVDAFNDMRTKLNMSIRDLTQSRELFAKTFFSAPLLMSISKIEDGEFIEVNDAFLSTSGFRREELIGHNSIELGWLTIEERQRIIHELQTSGRFMGMEFELTAKDGKKITCLYSGEIITIGDQKRLLLIGLDVSAERRLKNEQHEMKSKLEQAHRMEAIGRLAGGVAHDFNNKLSVIMGYAEMIKMTGKFDQQLDQELDYIIKAATQSQEITRQLLAFSRKEAILPKVININAHLRDELKLMTRLLGEDIEITFKLCDEPWPVLLDPSQFDQIIMNLSVNARDAMPLGGNIRFETQNLCLDRLVCSTCGEIVSGDYVLLAVSDTGTGIPADLLEHIFEPFFTTKETGKGTGLGLATVYGIISQNKGHINVSSTEGKGTRFSIYLPRILNQNSIDTDAQPKSILKGSESILLVEDEEELRLLLHKSLEDAGYSITSTSDPEEALGLISDKKRHIDLMLTDVIMPKINGKELEQKSLEFRPDLRVLFMSGYTNDIILKHGIRDGGVNFIQKPINLFELSGKIRSILAG